MIAKTPLASRRNDCRCATLAATVEISLEHHVRRSALA